MGLPGTAVGDARTDCTSQLKTVIAQYFAPQVAQTQSQGWTDGPDRGWNGPVEDDELIRKMLNSKTSANAAFGNKAGFADLWTGNIDALARAFPDPVRVYDCSSADAALAQHLAFWTGNDCERMRRLMRRSALVREKWEREDYLPRTISRACGLQTEIFNSNHVTKLPALPTAAKPLHGDEALFMQLGTQDSVAHLFARQMQGKMLYNHTRNKWFEWDGTRWQIESTEKALNFARHLARSVNSEGKSSLGSASFCEGVERMAKADPALAAKGTEFDTDNYLLNTPGGTLDLRTNILQAHNPENRLTLRSAVSPCSYGGTEFHKFLSEITERDTELEEFLQVSLGACLSGAVESHWMLFWVGQGRNGKNTLGDLVQDAMGDYARKVPSSTLMAKVHEGHPTEIANLQGIRLAISSEINDGEHWNEARINEVTGDAVLSARFMRGDLFNFQRTHKHLIYGNHRPQLRSVGNAIKSRIKIVPFKASFLGREDADLPVRLRKNLGYILAWLIEGHRKWLAANKRLPSCQAVDAESEDYFSSQSTVEMWLSERVQVVCPDERPLSHCPKSSALYNDYKVWKMERGENAISHGRWADNLRGFKKDKSNGVRYRGLMLISQVSHF